MHTNLRITLLCLTFGAVMVAQNSRDDGAVRAVVQKYLDTREHQDAKSLEALFTEDVDQLVSSGEWRKGRAAVVRGTLENSASAGGKRTITIESVRFPSAGVAIADGRYELTNMKGGESRKMWSTFFFVKSGGVWRISAIRNMLPAAPVPAK